MVTFGLIISGLISGLIIEYKTGIAKHIPFLKKVFGSPHA